MKVFVVGLTEECGVGRATPVLPDELEKMASSSTRVPQTF